MIKAGARALFDLVESFFTKYLPQQRGASPHTIRAYRDALKLLLYSRAVWMRDRQPPARAFERRHCGRLP